MKPGCAAILAIQLRTAVLGVRSIPASDATCAYANSEMSAMESESPTRKLRPVNLSSRKSRPFSPCSRRGPTSSGLRPVSMKKRAAPIPRTIHACSKCSHWTTRALSRESAGKYTLPSARYQRTAFDCTITSPSSSSRIGVSRAGLRRPNSGVTFVAVGGAVASLEWRRSRLYQLSIQAKTRLRCSRRRLQRGIRVGVVEDVEGIVVVGVEGGALSRASVGDGDHEPVFARAPEQGHFKPTRGATSELSEVRSCDAVCWHGCLLLLIRPGVCSS